MDLGLTDRVFVVTAASSGLGRATAEQLVAEGARVVLVARRAEVLDEVVAALGARPRGGAGRRPGRPGHRRGGVPLRPWTTFGRLDGALVSVGGPPAGSVLGTTDEQWQAGVRLGVPGRPAADRCRGPARHGRRPGARLGAVHLGQGADPRPGGVQRAAPRAGHAGQAAGRRARTGRHPGGRADARPGGDRAGAAPGLAVRRPGGGPGGVRGRRSRCVATAGRRSSAGWRPSCSPRPRPTSPARWSPWTAARCAACDRRRRCCRADSRLRANLR